ncbi:MAG: aerobic carbon-monoxide dehydrogenase medium subunit [Solirubrobacteraceae bacterium]|jgi:carbon-monoxide dehydrogenase medium subunit|nr:aerobic carbon-monoxide dehydrogenase medium subunit [Solirubrobacteraceae bacterium]
MRYLEPETVDEALDLLAEHGDDAKVIAGGQSLLILMRERLVDVDALVGLKAIAPLRDIEVNGGVRIGAMVTHSTVERDERIAARWPLLHAAEAAVSTLQVRNRGTLCGNVAHAFPTADPPAALVACEGVVHLASRTGGEREVAAEDFFVGLMQTEAGPEELVTAVSLPAQPEGARTAYMKYAIRPLDFAIVSVAVRIVPAADGTIADARIGLAGAANHTLRATEAERVLVGERPSAELLQRAGQAAARQADPLADVDGTVDYKRRVTGVFTARALARALE